MTHRLTRRLGLIALLVLSLPILLFVYQPAWKLGALGLVLGAVGYTISPLVLFGVLLAFIRQHWS